MTKGRNTTVITLRIPDTVVDYVDKRCEALRLSRNEYLNKVIANGTIRNR